MNEDHRWVDRLAAHWPATTRWRAIASGLVFGTSGALVALVIVVGYVGLMWVPSPDEIAGAGLRGVAAVFGLPLAAGLGAAIAGAPLWWLLVEKPDDPPKGRSSKVGALVGVLAHPLMWSIIGLEIKLRELLGGGTTGAGGNLVGEVLGGLILILLVTVVGLLITGVITVPVAAKIGVVLAHFREQVLETESEPSERGPQDL